MPSTPTQLDYPTPPKILPQPLQVKEYLQLTAGPTNISDRVKRALEFQCVQPISNEMFEMMDEVKAMLKYIFQTNNRLTLLIQTSGNGANEAIVTNILDPGDKLVVAVGGIWGDKVVDMAQRYNVDVLSLRKPSGEVYNVEELEEAIVQHKANVLFITQGESSGGTCQPLEGIGPMCHKHNCLLAVDAVVSIAVEPLYVDRWEIDAVAAGSQKAIGAPAGMGLLTFSRRAEERIMGKKARPPHYLDVIALANYWNCFNNPRVCHYTFSSNLVAAMREALAQICEEGVEEMWKRHRLAATHLWGKLEEMGFQHYVEKVESRLHGVTCVKLPKGVEEAKLLAYMRTKYAVEIGMGLGPTAGIAIRIGLLGINARREVVQFAVEALQDALNHVSVA